MYLQVENGLHYGRATLSIDIPLLVEASKDHAICSTVLDEAGRVKSHHSNFFVIVAKVPWSWPEQDVDFSPLGFGHGHHSLGQSEAGGEATVVEAGAQL